MSQSIRQVSVESQRPEDESSSLKPPQFGLRGMLCGVSCLCALFAIVASLGAVASVACSLLALLVAAHVAGNAIGTRLRGGATGSYCCVARGIGTDKHFGQARPPETRPPDTRLWDRTPVYRAMRRFVVAGAVAGGSLGGAWLIGTHWRVISWPGALVGCLSLGILGALFAFLASSFWRVTREALHEAAGEQNR